MASEFNPQVYPQSAVGPLGTVVPDPRQPGLLLRDAAALAALKGILARADFDLFGDDGEGFFADMAARDAYEIADAMLRARAGACDNGPSADRLERECRNAVAYMEAQRRADMPAVLPVLTLEQAVAPPPSWCDDGGRDVGGEG